MQLDFEKNFSISIPSENIKNFEDDNKRQELSLAIKIVTGDNSTTFDVYPDHITNGILKFSKLSGGNSEVQIAGSIQQVLDEKFNDSLIQYLQKNTTVDILVTFVSDSAGNWYYIDGDQKNIIKAGTAKLVK